MSRLVNVLACVALAATAPQAWAQDSAPPADPKVAFVPLQVGIAQEAVIYGLPILGMYSRMQSEALDPATRLAPLNQFYHYRELATPARAPFRAPNNDTLYSTAWLDLRGGPVVLDLPDTRGRYYTVQVMDLASDTLDNIGQRKYGTGAGRVVFVGPHHSGHVSEGARAVVRSPTPFVGLLMRILVDGPADVSNVNALQDGFRFTALEPVPPAPPATLPMRTPRERFEALNVILRSIPVRDGEQAVMGRFAHLGLGPVTTGVLLPPSDAVLAQAETQARPGVSAIGLVTGAFERGWRVIRGGLGTYGFDYLQRASVWDGGPLANVLEESFYPSALMDSDGQMLDGRSDYRLRFPPGALPPVHAFWSLTMYRMDNGYLVDNPLNRYSIGDRTPGIKYDTDGGLTILIQHTRPNDGNWLPAPSTPFYMVLRLYGPKPTALSGEWNPPAVERINR